MPSFRPAGPADLDALLPLVEAYYAEERYPFVREAARGALAGLLAEPAYGRVWVLEADDGGMVGYVVVTLGYSLEFHGRDAFIDELYILPALRGRGLGRDAVALAEHACRELGVRALHLEAERRKPRLHAWYRRLGFEDHDRRLMTKRLWSP
ncbi:MAG TPA: GNAT family N-acetyltransferase [Vicinamibacterales bacterium]|nr:GNAT family N-acetyltransferase [Vicinamibacterales bacterium]